MQNYWKRHLVWKQHLYLPVNYRDFRETGPRSYNRRFTVAVSWVIVVGGTLIWRKALIRAFSSIGHPYTKSIKGQILNNCFSCKYLNAIISIIIHCTHYLSSHWLRAYSEFWKSRSREVLSALAFGSAGKMVTLSPTLIIPDIAKTSSNNRLESLICVQFHSWFGSFHNVSAYLMTS